MGYTVPHKYKRAYHHEIEWFWPHLAFFFIWTLLQAIVPIWMALGLVALVQVLVLEDVLRYRWLWALAALLGGALAWFSDLESWWYAHIPLLGNPLIGLPPFALGDLLLDELRNGLIALLLVAPFFGLAGVIQRFCFQPFRYQQHWRWPVAQLLGCTALLVILRLSRIDDIARFATPELWHTPMIINALLWLIPPMLGGWAYTVITRQALHAITRPEHASAAESSDAGPAEQPARLN